MQRNAYGLGAGQGRTGTQTHGLQCPQAQLVLAGIQMLYVVMERSCHPDALLFPLLCKGDVVGQREGQVGIQLGAQGNLGLLGNICRCQKSVFRQVGQDFVILRVYVIKGAVDHRKVGQLIGHRVEAYPAAQNDHLTTTIILRHGSVIVDLTQQLHGQLPPDRMLKNTQ